MGKKFRIALVCVCLAVIGSFGLLALLRPPNPIFHGHPESYWIDGLRTNDYHSNDPTARWLEFGPEGVPLLIKALKTGTGTWDRYYLKKWPKFPVFIRSHISRPIDQSGLRAQAALLLGNLGRDPETQSAIPALIRGLHDPDNLVRIYASEALLVLMPEDAQGKATILPELLQALHDRDPNVRACALVGLETFTNQTTTLLPQIQPALGDVSPDVRLAAVQTLGKIDHQGTSRPALQKLLTDEDIHVRRSATNALATLTHVAIAKP